MITRNQPRLESFEPGDRFLFNDRSVPVTVRSAGPVGACNGKIYVEYIVVADGPAGGELWLERTGTGRKRIKESAPWGAYANVRRLEKVE